MIKPSLNIFDKNDIFIYNIRLSIDMVKLKKIKEQFAELDLKDRKILYELDVNARCGASRIAKKVGLSKQVVNYRINQLIERKIIEKFYAVYDTSKLGYTTYKIFLRLQNVNIKKQEEIVKYLINHPNVQFFMSSDGMFDLVFNVLAKDVLELHNILNILKKKYGKYIALREISIMIFSSFFFRDYLINKKPEGIRKSIYFGSKQKEVEIDQINKKILHYLGIDARMQITEVANNIGLSSDAVAIRIRKMEKAQIINNYNILPNFSLLNQISYKVLFSFHNSTEEKEKLFFEYCKSQPNIWFHSRLLGQWDLEINMDVDNANQFRMIMMEIKSKFSDLIKEYNTLQISKVHKFNFYPFKI
jgi:DNA-binding Lrp family transcriptional regulator